MASKCKHHVTVMLIIESHIILKCMVVLISLKKTKMQTAMKYKCDIYVEASIKMTSIRMTFGNIIVFIKYAFINIDDG